MRSFDSAMFSRGLFRGAAGDAAALEANDRAITSAGVSGRRIGIIHIDERVGATTIATELLRLLVSRRDQPVLGIDFTGSSDGLGGRIGAPAVPASSTRATARTTAEAIAGLPHTADGAYLLRPAGGAADLAATWISEAAPIVRFFDVVVVDFGARHPELDLAACASFVDVVCLVAAPTRAAAEIAASLAAGLAQLPERPAVVLTMVDRRRAAGTVPAVMAGHVDGPVVTIPHDRGLAARRPASSFAARAALLRLAATLVSKEESA